MKKFWTVKKKQVGTAHLDRERKKVDFRPGQVRMGFNSEHIVVDPPKGQEGVVQPLQLKVARKEKRVAGDYPQRGRDYPHKGQVWQREIFYAIYDGMEVSASGSAEVGWYDKEAEKLFRKKAEKEREKQEMEEKNKKVFLSSIILEEDVLPMATVSEIARLRAGNLKEKNLFELLLERKLQEKFGKDIATYPFCRNEADRRKEIGELDRFKKNLLAFDDCRQAERKQRWLAKKEEEPLIR